MRISSKQLLSGLLLLVGFSCAQVPTPFNYNSANEVTYLSKSTPVKFTTSSPAFTVLTVPLIVNGKVKCPGYLWRFANDGRQGTYEKVTDLTSTNNYALCWSNLENNYRNRCKITRDGHFACQGNVRLPTAKYFNELNKVLLSG